MKRTIHLRNCETGFIYRHLGDGRKQYPFATILQAIQHHQRGDLRYDRSTGKTRDNRRGVLAEWTHRCDAVEIRDSYSVEDIIEWIFAGEILNSCSRVGRGFDM